MRTLLSILRSRLLMTGFLLAAAFIVMPATAHASGFSGSGAGTREDPYVITTPDQLNEIRNNLSAHYRLDADIDLTEYGSYYDGGQGWMPIGTLSESFTGTLDGNGHTIHGLMIKRPSMRYAGLFCSTGSGSELRDLHLSDSKVEGFGDLGSLVGINKGSIIACSAIGTTKGRNVSIGGLVGKNGGYITGSYFIGSIFSNTETTVSAGGLAGTNDSYCTIDDSYAIINLTCDTNLLSRWLYSGGLVGENHGSISNSYAAGSITTGHHDINYTGGLVGYNYGSITGSHATADLTDNSSGNSMFMMGGLAGRNSGSITGSYSTGNVTRTGDGSVGGLIGYNGGSVTDNYALGTVSGGQYTGGLVGQNAYWVQRCYARGSVTNSSNYAGGLVGYGSGSGAGITDSYALGTVSGGNYGGGLVGFNISNVTNCYALGTVNAGTSGGLAGINNGTFSRSYWNSESSQNGIGGGTGSTNDIAGLTTAQMKKQDSFNGWDFTRTWTMDTGQTYPYLSGQAFFRDMAPPVFIDGCPSADNIGSASFYLQVSTDENANVYYVVLADGAQGPTSLQIKAGQDASGTNLAAGRKGSLTVTAGSMSAKAVTGLTATTPYDIYLAAEDTRGNLSILPAKLDVSTSSFSNENDITDFTVTGQTGASAIDTAGHTVEFHMPYGTNAASLTPTIAVSANAVIEPASGTAQDFTGPVYYTVTAQNGTPQVWTVTCIVDPAVIDAGKSTVSAQTTPASPAVNTIFIFTVNVHDAADIPIIGLAAGDFIITGDGSGSLTVDSITENGTAGGYTVAATYDTAETIAITVKVSGVEIGSITNVIIQNLSGFDVSASPGEKTADTPFDLSIANAKGMDGCYLNGNISVIVISDKDGEIHNAVVTVTTGAAIVPVTLTSAGNHMLTVTMTGVTDPENITVSIVPAVTYGNISGTVSYIDEGGGTGPLPGAMVTVASVGADYSAATTTAADGTYILTSVPAGTGYTVTAVKTGYVSKMTDDVTVTSGSAVTVNFALTANAIPSVNSVPNRKSDIPEATTARVTAYTAYTLDLSTIFEDELPASSLSGSQSASGPQGTGALTFSAPYGSIAITGDMLAGMAGTEGKKAGITIAQGDKSGLPEDVQAAIGDRPIVRLTLALDGRQTDWNNPDAPVTVNIPYTPTTEELASPEGIVIWYIDGSGNTVCIPNGRYDPVTGTVTFTAAHFSYYAVSYKKTGFKDVAKDAWYYKAVSFIAAREITLGTGGGNFSPDAKLTRGQFIVMLMRAYGIEPDADPDPNDNFADAGNTYYTGYLAAARRLGISAGVGNNMFAPEKEITRQEMFKLLYNALKVIGKLSGSSSEKTLSDFSDADEVAAWAYDAVKLFVESGIINGSGGKLDPLSTTTRGQMAQVLYILL